MGRRINKDILGGISGKVGPIVISKWNDISTVRARPGKRSNTKGSEGKTPQQKLFALSITFLRKAKIIINIGFQQARPAKMTPMNRATSYLLQHGMAIQDGVPYIDLPKIKFSKPVKSTELPWNAELKAEEGQKITLNWELNPFPKKCTQLDDELFLICYAKQRHVFIPFYGSTKRSDLQKTIVLQKSLIGDEIFCYLFFTSRDRKFVSETEYLGSVRLIP